MCIRDRSYLDSGETELSVYTITLWHYYTPGEQWIHHFPYCVPVYICDVINDVICKGQLDITSYTQTR